MYLEQMGAIPSSNGSLDRAWDLLERQALVCEELMFTTVAHRDLDLNQDSHGCKPSAFNTELSRCPLIRLQSQRIQFCKAANQV